MTKMSPWCEDSTNLLFNLDAEELDTAVSFREKIDYDYGIRFRGEYIRDQGWVVGFAHEKADSEDIEAKKFFENLRKIGYSDLIAIPAKDVDFERTRQHWVLTGFSPPLIAKAKASVFGYTAIRRSDIQQASNVFFVFPSDQSCVMLRSNGNYTMIAGEEEFVTSIFEGSINSSWDDVRSNNKIDPLILYRLRACLIAYGLSRPNVQNPIPDLPE